MFSDPKQTQSWNLYQYANNNPLRYVDPTGHVTAPILKCTPGTDNIECPLPPPGPNGPIFINPTRFIFPGAVTTTPEAREDDRCRAISLGNHLMARSVETNRAAGYLAAGGLGTAAFSLLFPPTAPASAEMLLHAGTLRAIGAAQQFVGGVIHEYAGVSGRGNMLGAGLTYGLGQYTSAVAGRIATALRGASFGDRIAHATNFAFDQLWSKVPNMSPQAVAECGARR